MNVQLHPSWKEALQPEFGKNYFKSLVRFVKEEYTNYSCYPAGRDIFAAFDSCPLDEVRIVILGQDPYHGPKQANGLCFSVNDGIPHPPSLVNILREVEQDLGVPYPLNGDLQRWAKQGVFLLNATLTVRQGQAGSHQNKGWELFTDAVISTISNEKEKVIFLLWGAFAKKKSLLIDKQKHHILSSGHPSPLSANRGLWFGNHHFSSANKLLQNKGDTPVRW